MLTHMCWGCSKARGWNATGWICSVYYKPHETLWARHNKKCPFNGGFIEQAKLIPRKVRAGQQKQTKNK